MENGPIFFAIDHFTLRKNDRDFSERFDSVAVSETKRNSCAKNSFNRITIGTEVCLGVVHMEEEVQDRVQVENRKKGAT